MSKTVTSNMLQADGKRENGESKKEQALTDHDLEAVQEDPPKKTRWIVASVVCGVACTLFILFIIGKNYAYKHELTKVYIPSSNIRDPPPGLAAESILFPAADGTMLHAYHVPPDLSSAGPSTPIMGVLVFLGSNENNSIFWRQINEWTRKQAGNCPDRRLAFFIPAYRGYGLSEGSPTEQNLTKDAKLAHDTFYNRLAKTYPNREIKRIVLGWSLGGAVAIDLASKKVNIDGLILEATFTTMERVVGDLVPLVKRATWLVSQKWNSIGKIHALDKQVPVLLVYGEFDQFKAHMLDLEAKIKSHGNPVRAVMVPGAFHMDCSLYEAYTDAVSKFSCDISIQTDQGEMT